MQPYRRSARNRPAWLTVLLLVLIGHLGYGVSALAVDHGSGAGPGHHQHASLSHVGDHGQADTGCDHCCHAAAHLLGVTSRHLVSPPVKGAHPRPCRTQGWRSRIQTPPTRPPRPLL
ncbi:MAG: hypothetical protein WAM94_14220 [Chromatiaceae bacterium]